jgi:hypothetical protein
VKFVLVTDWVPPKSQIAINALVASVTPVESSCNQPYTVENVADDQEGLADVSVTTSPVLLYETDVKVCRV